MFSKVLIANRGEIALRILRACKELGIQTVAVHSTADSNAMHVRLADESVCIGPPGQGLLPQHSGHHGRLRDHRRRRRASRYGFLSENARFARILEEHKVTFIGPSSHHIEIMGDKITAKQTAKELGIPVVPAPKRDQYPRGRHRAGQGMGYPVIVKATAGGGGRGMKVARNDDEIASRSPRPAPRAKAAFGNDSVYIEKYLQKPRHIEVQLMGDGKGNAVHHGTRELLAAGAVTRRSSMKRPRPPCRWPSSSRSARSAPPPCAS